MSGRVGDLSPKQAEALKSFKEKVKSFLKPELQDDDHYLLRWLRARNFDLKKSENMLRNHTDWRKKMGIDTIKEDFKNPEVLLKYDGGGFFGFDKDGCPIWIYPLGCLDPKGLLRSITKREMIRHKIVLLERLFDVFQEESKKQGKIIDQVVIIHDLDKLGMRHLWKPGVDVFNEIMQIFEAHYPETLKHGIVLNAPKIFPIAFNLVKPFLSAETLKKTKVFGRNYKPELLKYINADQLPAHFGGTCQDPDGDPKCTSRIGYAGEVPKSYYCQLSQEEMDKFMSITVKQGSSASVDIDVPEVNSALRWQFTTNGNDIKFGVSVQTKNSGGQSEDIEVIPGERVNSHLVPEDGFLTCKYAGKYMLNFDNSYSWVRSKTINYFVEVLKPDQDAADIPTDLVSSDSAPSFINTASQGEEYNYDEEGNLNYKF